MAYVEYEFYKTKYFGTAIVETDFPRYAEQASDRIDFYTCDRLSDGLPSDGRAAVKVQKAVCAVADILFKLDKYAQDAEAAAGFAIDEVTGKMTGKVITGKSAGGESISYSAGTSDLKNSSAIAAVMTDRNAQQKLQYDAAREYLTGVCTDDGTPLLYLGM